MDAAALIFFAYIGFDAVSTSGEESKRPSRDLPIAIVGSLLIATVLYVVVALVAVGGLPAKQLAGSQAPLADVIEKGAGHSWGSWVISLGALVSIMSVVLSLLYGQTRITLAMSRDGLIPRSLARVSQKRRTPARITLFFGCVVSLLAAFIPLSTIAKLVNIGTLFAFLLVNIGVIVLRRTRPDLERGFRVPFVPVFPLIGAGLCIFLMKYLDGATWVRFAVWLIIGLCVYALYGWKHSRLRGERQPGRATAGARG